MSYVDHVEDFPTCSSIPHAILNIQVVYCPHDRGYSLSMTLGDESDVPWSTRRARYGPFDDHDDLVKDIGAWVAVIFRRTLLDATLEVHDRRLRAPEITE